MSTLGVFAAGGSASGGARRLTVVAETDEPVTYEATTTGRFADRAHTVEDAVAADSHDHAFDGELAFLDLRGGPATVFVDGSPVDPATVG